MIGEAYAFATPPWPIPITPLHNPSSMRARRGRSVLVPYSSLGFSYEPYQGFIHVFNSWGPSKPSERDLVESLKRDLVESSWRDLVESFRRDFVESLRQDLVESSWRDLLESLRWDLVESLKRELVDSSWRDLVKSSWRDLVESLMRDLVESLKRDLVESLHEVGKDRHGIVTSWRQGSSCGRPII